MFPQVDDKNPTLLFTPNPDATTITVQRESNEAIAQVDVAFPVLHGPWGEDGTIQGLLELAVFLMLVPECLPALLQWTKRTLKP